MERRSRIVLNTMAFLLIVLSGVSLWTTVLKVDLLNSEVSNIAYNNSGVVNTITGEFDLSVEESDELTIKSVNTNSDTQVCSYSVIYSTDSFASEFYVTINGEDVLVDSSNVLLFEGTYTVESNDSVENIFAVSSYGNNGIIKISNVECFIVE